MKRGESSQLKLALILKAHQLSKAHQSHITADDVLNTLKKKWEKETTLRFHQMVFDIFEVSIEEVVQATILHTMKKSLRAPLSDYDDLFGGSQ